MNFIDSQKTFTRSFIDTSNLIDRSNSWMLGAVACLILAVCPIPNITRVSFGLLSVGFMHRSGKLLDKAKDNPQRRHFEKQLNKLDF